MTRATSPRLLALLVALLTQVAPALAQQVAEQVLADLPELVELLPRRPGTGEIIGIQKVREMQRFMERKIEREVVRRHFPHHTRRSKPEMWREVTVEGRSYQVPNESHPAYREMTKAYETRVRQNDAEFQTRFGRRYEEFSRRAVDALRSQDRDGVRLVGKAQRSHHSDLDATIRDPAVHAKVVEAFARQDLTVQDDPRYAAAMADREVAATNEGARENLFGTGVRDGKGARLDHIKKYAQSEDGYTRNKIVGKLEALDGASPRARTAEAAKARDAHQGATRTLRMIGWPDPAKRAEEAAFLARRQDDLVDSYRRASLDHHAQQRQRNQMVAAYSQLASTFRDDGDPDRAARFEAEARRVMRDSALLTRTNAETMRAIEAGDPPLARRLRAADREAQAEYRRRNGARARHEAETGDVALARALVGEQPEAPKPVVAGTARRILGGAEAAFGHAGSVSKYLGMVDEALMREAEGQGSAVKYLATKIAVDKSKDAALGYVAKKVPGFGAVLELADVPDTLMAEFDTELERAEREGTSAWAGKGRAILSTIKKSTFIGTYEDILQEEGMDEVRRELDNGRYDWAGVALRTAYRTTGEVTGINEGLRTIANFQEGVVDATRARHEAIESLRGAVRARTLGAQGDLDTLRDQIVELQLSPDADTPRVKRQLARLQARHDASVDQLHSMAKRIRRTTSSQDRQTEELYARTRIAREEQDVALTRARMVRLVSAEDTTHPAVLDRLVDYREEHRRSTQALRERCQELFEQRGNDDPFVKEMLGKLRRAKAVQQEVDAIDVKEALAEGERRAPDRAAAARDAWWAEVEQAHETRRAELQGLRDELVAHAGEGGPTHDIDPGDEALVVELEDLRLRQEAVEFSEDLDLVAEAYRNVARDAHYRSLRTQLQAGELPEDADLAELMERYDASRGAPPASEGGASEFEGDAVEPEEDEPVGSDGADDKDPFAYLDHADASDIWTACCPPWLGRTRTVDGDPEAKGPRQGPRRRHASDGTLTGETWWKDGKRHGPERKFDSRTGDPSSERWYRDGDKYGPYRSWNKDGSIKEEGCVLDREKLLDRRFYKGTTTPKLVRALDPTQGEPRKRPNISRRYFEDGTLQQQSRVDPARQPVGLQVRTPTRNVGGKKLPAPVEEVYGPDGLLRSRKERWGDQPVLEETFAAVDAKAVLDGPRKTWFPPGSDHAGQPLLEEAYEEGARHGPYRRFDEETGSLAAEGRFVDGVLDGAWRWFHPDGSPHVEATFDAGFLAGTLLRRDAEGRKQEEAHFAAGRPTLLRRFHQGALDTEHQGALEARTCASPAPRGGPTPPGGVACQPGLRGGQVTGVADGRIREYHLDGPAKGKVKNERLYRAGKAHGTWTYGFDDGTPWTRERYQAGKLHGLQESFYLGGSPEYRVGMAEGRRHGAFEYWSRDGKLQKQATYREGWRKGWGVEFHPSGEAKERAHYQPATRSAPEVPGGKSRLGFGWKSSLPAYAEDLYGPWVRLRRDGSVEKVSFHRGTEASTEDEAEYRRWRAEYPGLPEKYPR